MIKANPTIFKFYLSIMDSFSEYLSNKYTEGSLDNPNHYKTIIIQKVVRMFHTLERLVKESQDEVSARCVLRGILDSVTAYCFVYQREDRNEMMFRHYLYLLDGLTIYKKVKIDRGVGDAVDKYKFGYAYNEVIGQIKKKLSSHPYAKLNNKSVEEIVKRTKWKYKSLDKPNNLSFLKMYQQVGYEASLTDFYQDILSQYAHGLCISNTHHNAPEQLQIVLYESIPIADRMIQAIRSTFSKKELLLYVYRSEIIKKLLEDPEFNTEDLFPFLKALIENDKTLFV